MTQLWDPSSPTSQETTISYSTLRPPVWAAAIQQPCGSAPSPLLLVISHKTIFFIKCNLKSVNILKNFFCNAESCQYQSTTKAGFLKKEKTPEYRKSLPHCFTNHYVVVLLLRSINKSFRTCSCCCPRQPFHKQAGGTPQNFPFSPK